MYRVTKIIKFDAAHRLSDYVGKCANVHGHEYKVEVTLSAFHLTDNGFVLDFNEFKKLKDWIDYHWDHAYISGPTDDVWDGVSCEMKTYNLPANPTVENMCYHLYWVAKDMFDDRRVCVDSIVIWETSTSKCTYSDK